MDKALRHLAVPDILGDIWREESQGRMRYSALPRPLARAAHCAFPAGASHAGGGAVGPGETRGRKLREKLHGSRYGARLNMNDGMQK